MEKIHMKNNPSIHDCAYLAKGRNKQQRKLHGRSTALVRHDDQAISVRYHNTDIVTYRQNGDTVLNSGGYKTATTKARINEYASVRLYQNKSIWYINGELFPLHADGKVTGTAPVSDAKRQAKLVRDINHYAKAYVDALLAGNVPAPSAGDCWMCSMFKTDDTEHLVSSITCRRL
jgi:hypothetical protein